MKDTLYLYEQLQLLSMRDEDGKPHDYNLTQRVGYALAGGALMDLLLGGYIGLDEKKNCIPKQHTAPNVTLNSFLQRIAKAKKPKDAKYWVQILYTYNTTSGRLLQSLIDRGIVRKELRKQWKIFTVKRFPVTDIAAKQAIINRLENLLGTEEPPEYETLVLLSLVKSARLIQYVFPERFRNNPTALDNDVRAALKKQPHGTFTDEAIEDAERRQEIMEAMEVSLDMLMVAVDVISDAVGSFGDAGGDGGSDGGGDGGGGGH
jgi:hypothetical protein